MSDDAATTIAHWQGDMLWPTQVEDGTVIDMSAVEALGSWVYAWLRRRSRQAVVGAAPELRRQLQRADLPLLWYGSLAEVQSAAVGVTPSERAMLWE